MRVPSSAGDLGFRVGHRAIGADRERAAALDRDLAALAAASTAARRRR
jgi:hypothetical protein